MAQGLLGKADLTANTDVLLFTAASVQTFNVRVANRNTAAVKIRVAIGTGASPAVGDFITYDLSVAANGVLEETGLVCNSGEKIWVRTDTAGVSARAHGL